MKKNKLTKGFAKYHTIFGFTHIILLMAIVLIGIAGVGYFAYKNGQVKIPSQSITSPVSDTMSESAIWQTYTNEKYLFSVRYPNDWKLTSAFADKNPESVRFTKITNKNGKYYNESTVDITVELHETGEPLSKEWYIERLKSLPLLMSTNVYDYNYTKAEFQGYEALWVNDDTLFFVKDDNLYSSGWLVAGEEKDQLVNYTENIFDQILSTFEFIDDDSPKICYTNPRESLDDFLNYLQDGDFIQASRLYDGDYLLEVAKITPSNTNSGGTEKIIVEYLSDYCNGYGTCLSHKISKETKMSDDKFIFKVIFDPENGPYQFCGPEDGNPRTTPNCYTEVDFTIQKINNCFKSIDMIPITP